MIIRRLMSGSPCWDGFGVGLFRNSRCEARQWDSRWVMVNRPLSRAHMSLIRLRFVLPARWIARMPLIRAKSPASLWFAFAFCYPRGESPASLWFASSRHLTHGTDHLFELFLFLRGFRIAYMTTRGVIASPVTNKKKTRYLHRQWLIETLIVYMLRAFAVLQHGCRVGHTPCMCYHYFLSCYLVNINFP